MGDGFPGNRLLFLCSEGDAGGLLKVAKGREGGAKPGVQSDMGWLRELREQGKQLSAIIQSASVLVSHPSL